MDSRDAIFDRVRTALGRKLGQKPLPPPEPLLRVGHQSLAARIGSFKSALEALNGTVTVVPDSAAVGAAVEKLLDGQPGVASNHPFLAACGIPGLNGVTSGITATEELRNACAAAGIGITSAYCLLAETGTIVLRARPDEPRLLSLLPPVHIAVVHQDRLLTNLDEMLSMIPRPVDDSSAMIFITGPSRTGDIEQFLVRGVHGPGAVHVIIVQGKNPSP
ncbi:MAG: lactate utilization protein C [Bryobacteraceae bacterium]